jgi:GTP-binding protein
MPFTVVILGRPNVGKSTLFNRLVGRRQALVDDRPGVTRDRIEGLAEWGPRRFRVIDTAGLDQGGEASLAGRLRRQTMAGLAEADLGLLVVDCRAGLTPLDQEVAATLRRQAKPVIVVANKAEGEAATAAVQDAWSLGLGEPVAVSAEHGDGLPDLLAAIGRHLPASGDEPAAPAELPAVVPPIRLAVVGRPNVGKSSLVNRLIAEERLLTGPEPGLTRDAISVPWRWQGRPIELVDTAGLRRRARVEERLERLSASATLRALRFAHVALLVVDARQPLENQDLVIAARCLEEGRALVVCANKWDLVEEPAAQSRLIRDRLEAGLPQARGVSWLPVSAATGHGTERIPGAVLAAYERWERRVPTAQLNRWLQAALEAHPPPLVGGRRIKLRYVTQAKGRPPTFALFANMDPADVPQVYLRYLTQSLREAFDLQGVPIRLHVRHRENPYEGR